MRPDVDLKRIGFRRGSFGDYLAAMGLSRHQNWIRGSKLPADFLNSRLKPRNTNTQGGTR